MGPEWLATVALVHVPEELELGGAVLQVDVVEWQEVVEEQVAVVVEEEGLVVVEEEGVVAVVEEVGVDAEEEGVRKGNRGKSFLLIPRPIPFELCKFRAFIYLYNQYKVYCNLYKRLAILGLFPAVSRDTVFQQWAGP